MQKNRHTVALWYSWAWGDVGQARGQTNVTPPEEAGWETSATRKEPSPPARQAHRLAWQVAWQEGWGRRCGREGRLGFALGELTHQALRVVQLQGSVLPETERENLPVTACPWQPTR